MKKKITYYCSSSPCCSAQQRCEQICSNSGDIKVDKRYYLKIGNGFLFLPEVVDSFRIRKGVKQPRRIARGKIACFTDQAKATKLKFSPEQGGTSLIQSFEASDYKGKYGGPIVYSIDGEILSTGATLYSFNYVNEGGKYYLKAAEVGRWSR